MVEPFGIVGHLADVAAFVDCQLHFPVERVERCGGRRGIEFDAAGSPGDHAVAVQVVRLQDHRHVRRFDVQAGQGRCAGLFKSVQILPGEGIDLRRVDDVEVLPFELAPARTERCISRQDILSLCRQAGQQQEKSR